MSVLKSICDKKHGDWLLDMYSEVSGKVLDVVKEVVKERGIEYFNLVVNNGKISGKLIPHFHLHILPRRKGDEFGMNV